MIYLSLDVVIMQCLNEYGYPICFNRPSKLKTKWIACNSEHMNSLHKDDEGDFLQVMQIITLEVVSPLMLLVKLNQRVSSKTLIKKLIFWI